MAQANGPPRKMIDEQSFRFVLRSHQNRSIFCLGSVDQKQLLAETGWQIDKLQALREELNKCKAQVGAFPLYSWEKHTESTEISSSIRKVILQRFTVRPPILTRAWIKFYDIMATFPLFGSTDDCTIHSLFLCEAPGAFVNAMNHYIKTNFCNINFNWIATTLNPYYEQIDLDAFVLDDRFISDSHCFRNWFFASLNTGDLLHEKFSDDLQAHICATYKLSKAKDCVLFDCVTGDGAFNCLKDPERQEEMVFKLIFKEVTVGTRFLKHNGSMVVKFFTFFSCETISLLYFICNCFQEVVCYKPVASKHGNSEVYLVCLRFDRHAYLALRPLLDGVRAEDFIIRRDLISQQFVDQVSALCQQIAYRQMESINCNVKLFHDVTAGQRKAIAQNKNLVGRQFLTKFRLQSLPLSEQLIYGDRYRKVFNRRLSILLDEYQHHQSKATFCSQLVKAIDELDIDASPQVLTVQNRINAQYKPTYGKPFECLNNSKFCCAFVLHSFTIASSHSPFTRPTTPCAEALIDTWQSAIKANHRIYFYQRTPFSEYFDQEWTARHATGVHYCTVSQSDDPDCSPLSPPNSPAIHFFDLYDNCPSITSNDFALCHSLRNSFSQLVANNRLQLNHALAIRFRALLSRLSVSLVYVLSKAFRRLTIFAHFTPTDSINPSLFVVMSGYRQLPPQYQCLLDEEQSNQVWTDNLLELVSVPDIVADQNLYDSLFQVNCVSILNCIKNQLVDQEEAGKKKNTDT